METSSPDTSSPSPLAWEFIVLETACAVVFGIAVLGGTFLLWPGPWQPLWWGLGGIGSFVLYHVLVRQLPDDVLSSDKRSAPESTSEPESSAIDGSVGRFSPLKETSDETSSEDDEVSEAPTADDGDNVVEWDYLDPAEATKTGLISPPDDLLDDDGELDRQMVVEDDDAVDRSEETFLFEDLDDKTSLGDDGGDEATVQLEPEPGTGTVGEKTEQLDDLKEAWRDDGGDESEFTEEFSVGDGGLFGEQEAPEDEEEAEHTIQMDHPEPSDLEAEAPEVSDAPDEDEETERADGVDATDRTAASSDDAASDASDEEDDLERELLDMIEASDDTEPSNSTSSDDRARQRRESGSSSEAAPPEEELADMFESPEAAETERDDAADRDESASSPSVPAPSDDTSRYTAESSVTGDELDSVSRAELEDANESRHRSPSSSNAEAASASPTNTSPRYTVESSVARPANAERDGEPSDERAEPTDEAEAGDDDRDAIETDGETDDETPSDDTKGAEDERAEPTDEAEAGDDDRDAIEPNGETDDESPSDDTKGAEDERDEAESNDGGPEEAQVLWTPADGTEAVSESDSSTESKAEDPSSSDDSDERSLSPDALESLRGALESVRDERDDD